MRALAESLVAAEQRRRRAAEVLRALVPTLAQTLDIRDIFGQIASAAREIIPHELLELGILDESPQNGTLYAASEGEPQDVRPFQIPEALRPTLRNDFAIIRAMKFDPGGVVQGLLVTSDNPVPQPVEVTLPVGRFDRQLALGICSHLRVPVMLQGEMVAC